MLVAVQGSTRVECLFGLARTKASRRPSSVFEPARLLMTRAPHGCTCSCTNGRMSGRISLAAAPRIMPSLLKKKAFPKKQCKLFSSTSAYVARAERHHGVMGRRGERRDGQRGSGKFQSRADHLADQRRPRNGAILPAVRASRFPATVQGAATVLILTALQDSRRGVLGAQERAKGSDSSCAGRIKCVTPVVV